MTNSHRERMTLLDKLMRLCRENKWNDQTPAISDKIDPYLLGYNRKTREEYRRDVITALAQERVSGKEIQFLGPGQVEEGQG